MTPVQSSNIAAIGHDPINLTLTVAFKSGARYMYQHVPTNLFDQLIKSDSVGSAFHKLIKSQPDKHPFSQLP
jgi:hypothetical protein